jgi:hypothetical protein
MSCTFQFLELIVALIAVILMVCVVMFAVVVINAQR